MKSDRVRQELLAKERLEKLRNKKRSQQEVIPEISPNDTLQNVLIAIIERRHILEREVRIRFVEYPFLVL